MTDVNELTGDRLELTPFGWTRNPTLLTDEKTWSPPW
jgi:hypothetical protein